MLKNPCGIFNIDSKNITGTLEVDHIDDQMKINLQLTISSQLRNSHSEVFREKTGKHPQ